MNRAGAKRLWIWIEALSLVPASAGLPILMGVVGIAAWASLIASLSDPSRSFRLLDANLFFWMVLWAVAPAPGLIALWTAVLDAASGTARSARGRVFQIVGILSGFAALIDAIPYFGASDYPFWSVFLTGPVVAGIHHLFRLLRPAR